MCVLLSSSSICRRGEWHGNTRPLVDSTPPAPALEPPLARCPMARRASAGASPFPPRRQASERQLHPDSRGCGAREGRPCAPATIPRSLHALSSPLLLPSLSDPPFNRSLRQSVLVRGKCRIEVQSGPNSERPTDRAASGVAVSAPVGPSDQAATATVVYE